MAVHRRDLLDVGFEKVALQEPGDDPLDHAFGRDDDLLGPLGHGRDEIGRPGGEAETQPGPEDLGEGLADRDGAGVVEFGPGDVPDRIDPPAHEPEIAVGLVLEDQDIQFPGDPDQLPAPGQAHRPAAGILKLGDRVDELDGPAFLPPGEDRLPDAVHEQAFLVHAHGGQLRSAGLDRDERAVERRPLADDDVAGIDDRPGEEIDAVGRAVRNQELFLKDAGLLLEPENLLLEKIVPFARSVLENIGPFLFDHFLEKRGELFLGEGIGAGQAAGQGDHPLDPLGRLDHLPDERNAHRPGGLGKQGFRKGHGQVSFDWFSI